MVAVLSGIIAWINGIHMNAALENIVENLSILHDASGTIIMSSIAMLIIRSEIFIDKYSFFT